MATIVCVEDEEAIREDIADELRDSGHDVIEACDGADGLKKIAEHKPDLVISDITMPNMDGLTLLSTLREQHPNLVDVPFIFLSALADREDQLRGIELGVDDYLTKPIDFDLLLATAKSRISRFGALKKQKEAEFTRLYQSLAAKKQASDQSQPPEAVKKEKTPKSLRILTVSGAPFFVIELSVVRQMLGDKWDRYSDMVDDVSTEVIRKHLGREGIFRRKTIGEYGFSFPSLGEKEARARATLIHNELFERLMGSENAA